MPGVYCNECGKKNHFSKGTIIYENATVGSYNYFSPYSLINNAIIGNYCAIGPSCKIGLGEHDYSQISILRTVRNMPPESMYNRPTVIGNDVWLGADVIVRQGVRIGNGAVVGANSFVNKDIPDYAIAVGSPAKVINNRFSDEIKERINSSQWFNQDIANARQIIKELNNGVGV